MNVSRFARMMGIAVIAALLITPNALAFEIIEFEGRAELGATLGLTNIAAAANGGAAFDSGFIAAGFEADKAIDGNYDDASGAVWIADSNSAGEFIGVVLASPATVDKVAFTNPFTAREVGSYEVQVTTDADPTLPGATWTTVGTVDVNYTLTRRLVQFAPQANVTGVRLLITSANIEIAVSELEVYEALSPTDNGIEVTHYLAPGNGPTKGYDNIALSATPFARSTRPGFFLSALNDEDYTGVTTVWRPVGGQNFSWAGYALAAPTNIDRINVVHNRGVLSLGTYEIQYTTIAGTVDETTPDGDWETLGTFAINDRTPYTSAGDAGVPNDLLCYMSTVVFDEVLDATGVRVRVSADVGETAIQELEVFDSTPVNPLATLELIGHAGAFDQNFTGLLTNVAPLGTPFAANFAFDFTEDGLIDETYGSGPSGARTAWVPSTPTSRAGVILDQAYDVAEIAISERNLTSPSNNPRAPATYELQYTTDAGLTPATEATANWITIGTWDFPFIKMVRKVFRFDPVTGATAFRIVVNDTDGGSTPRVDEFEIYEFNADVDGDGLEDAWEREFFGNLIQEASGDPDGDGLTNEQEETGGTNPAVENTLPTVTVDPLVTTNTTPTLTGTADDASGIVSVEVTVAGQVIAAVVTPGSPSTWSADVPNPIAGGTYDVVAEAVDGAGNSATDATTDELTVDSSEPVFSNVQIFPATVQTGGTVSITFTVSEPLDGDPDVTVDGTPASLVSSSPSGGGVDYVYTFTVGEDPSTSTVTIQISGVDDLGNAGQIDVDVEIVVSEPVPLTAWPFLLALLFLGMLFLRPTRGNQA